MKTERPTSQVQDRVTSASERRRRRPTKNGRVLSHEYIVQTALRLIEEHGADPLSVRRLGLALGADPSSVYKYFESADDLMLAVADELIGRTLAGWVPTGMWRDDLAELGRRMHAMAMAHPRASTLSSFRVTGRSHEIQAVETILGVLRGAGFSVAEAVRSYHVFVDQALAYGALDAACSVMSQSARTAQDQVWRSTYGRLPVETHPHIATCARSLAWAMEHSSYPAAMHMLLSFLDSRLQQESDPPGL